MSYRCEVCRVVAPPGRPKLRHVVRKPDGNTARELAVCNFCDHRLRRGESLQALVHEYAAPAVVLPPPPDERLVAIMNAGKKAQTSP